VINRKTPDGSCSFIFLDKTSGVLFVALYFLQKFSGPILYKLGVVHRPQKSFFSRLIRFNKVWVLSISWTIKYFCDFMDIVHNTWTFAITHGQFFQKIFLLNFSGQCPWAICTQPVMVSKVHLVENFIKISF
jgi:hypothetical protein